MLADIWKDRHLAKAFLTERCTVIPGRPRQPEVLLRVLRTRQQATTRDRHMAKIGFQNVDCFCNYFELAVFGGGRKGNGG